MQVHKYVGVTQKTAWFMLQRVRHVIENSNGAEMIGQTVEIDETYIAGKHRGKRSSGANHKTPIIGMVERKGLVRAQHVVNTKSKTIQKLARENVSLGSQIMTDEYRSYNRVDELGYNHKSVAHSIKEFARGDIHTNTIEGFWSHLKRGIDGVYHHLSPKHLQKYCSEYEYRYNARDMRDLQTGLVPQTSI